MVLCLALHQVLLACGCDMLISYQGIMPSDYQGMIGMNMRQRYFKGAAMLHTHSNGSNHAHGEMSQLLTNYEINYRFFISKKLMITGNIPIADYQLSSSKLNTAIRNTGISDPLLMLKYEAVSPLQNEESKLKHRLLLGLGTKLPLGTSYKGFTDDLPEDENLLQLQLGSGSIDWVANVNYQFRKYNSGLQTDVSYKLNTPNHNSYSKGNQLNVQSNFFYQKRWSKTVLMPYLGIGFEHSNEDKINKTILINTGGSNAFANLGTEIFIRNFSLYFTYQHLILNQLNGFQMKNNYKFTLGINYNFKIKSSK